MLGLWLSAGALGVLVLPWYQVQGGWLSDGPGDPAPAILQGGSGRWWVLLPVAVLALALLARCLGGARRPALQVWLGLVGLALMLVQVLAVGAAGWRWPGLQDWLGPVLGQPGLGLGAATTALSFLFLVTSGLAARGWMRGDAFVVSAIGLLITLVAVFVFYPVLQMLAGGFSAAGSASGLEAFAGNLLDRKIWSLGCLAMSGRCGVAWNTLLLAVATATGTTVLGLALALVATRTGFRFKRSLRLLSLLPIITPPFVVGLALILLFGRSGVVTQAISGLFGVPAGRWLYGLPGVWLAQMLSFTPIAFMVLIGVVEGVSPSMEEASQTLRADRWQTFLRVSLPLMRPGIANAFLLAFVESMADFGNPLVLGGNFGVLSTEIFFSVVGAQNDPGRAAVLAALLLGFTLTAFVAQRRWVGRNRYTTITGKGDSGVHPGLNPALGLACQLLALPWLGLTLVIYGMILFGGFVRTWGRDHSLTFVHYSRAFGIEAGPDGWRWIGVAWGSFWQTMEIALIAAPLTAAVGLLAAYLLVRQRFVGQQIFEFALMLSFAIPGTVIGISYVLAFNQPPIEITGTAMILVVCFVFRNMPVGVRGGIAAMSQLDRSLDEASLTLGATSLGTLRRVTLPLLRPAVVAALVYAFVRSITSISAVIFLVSAEHNMATAYIVGLVENGEYGVAIAYASALIVVMLAAIALIQLTVGQRRLRRQIRIGGTSRALSRSLS
ncbi:ABC transporter permease [Inquilinus sp. OTU3971]|uniref:ABC transporter permease n=1 Tax=Inquilinus sp. OTU3971 TaxID=3043855 RepID=UPI00313B1CA6